MANIRVPSALRRFTGGEADIEVSGSTVREVLHALEMKHPGIGAKLIVDSKVKPFIRIFVGPDDIGELGGLDAKISDRDELSIVPAIAGG